ncbi:MAG TPA: GNAT family N-acetyltransferase [Terracidiphilus sp.]|nr:GNAT family N-acetyltransferase [Terracidiphilus sp.]
MTHGLQIRPLNDADPEVMERAFSAIGWSKPASQFRRYLGEQSAGTRSCWVAILNQTFAGYVTVNWKPPYPAFAEYGIPEIQDLNVLSSFRRKGIASALLDFAETEVAPRSELVGIAVGLHPGYNAAQKLYGKRGYIPDGRGITYKLRSVQEGEQVTLDDSLLLHLTKRIRC